MAQIFDEQVFVDGSADEVQVRVQGHSAQSEPLQTWEDSTGAELVRITSEGKLQIGDLGVSTPEAFIEAGGDLNPSSPKPKRGLHALGRFTGALGSALTWAVHELELFGSGGITTLQTALRAKVINDNSGTVTDAEFRAGDFVSVNQRGTGGNRVKQITGIRGAAQTTTGAYTSRAVGVEGSISNDTSGSILDAAAFEAAVPINSGAITNLYGLRIPDLTQGSTNYAIHTGQGTVHVGGHQELSVLASSPGANPPANFIKLYPKLTGGVPTLYAKDSSGVEYVVGGSGALSAPLTLIGSTDVIQFTVRGAATQTADLLRLEKQDGTPVAHLSPNGAWRVWGQADDVRLFAKGSSGQSQDMLRLEASDGSVLMSVSGTGATWIEGRGDNTQLTVKGSPSQTVDLVQIQTYAGYPVTTVSATGEVRIAGAGDMVQLVVQESGNQSSVTDIQRWQNRYGTVVASMANSGELSANEVITAAFRLTPDAGSGKVLTSDASGNATWQTPAGSGGTVTSVGLSAPSIFSVTGSPVTTAGTLSMGLTNQSANQIFAGPSSGGAAAPAFRTLAAADISSALASPPAIGGTTPAAGTFTALNATTSVTATVSDSGTNTTPSAGILRHNSSGTPAAGFGVTAIFQAKSTTTNNRDQGRIRTQWATATDASRKAKMILSVYDTAEREGLAIEASGSAPMIGFLGATPVVRQTGGAKTAAATYGANEQSMLQIVYNAMRTYGLLT
ncbi:MAG: hypothetical protein JNL42_18415 [Anaerolineae bacterium]|nr:hypothetical protein [Anaerolineae bacterium]